MERDFLGLNQKNSSQKVEGGSQDIYKHSAPRSQQTYAPLLLSPPQFPFSKARNEDDTFFPSRIRCNSQPLSLAKDIRTSPFNKMPSNSSTNLSTKTALVNNTNSITALPKWQCCEGASIATPLSNPSPTNGSLYDLYNKPNNNLRNDTASLTVFYSGVVHVFHDIPTEKADLIMHVAGTKPFTADAKEILDRLIQENYGNSMQPPSQNSFVYCTTGGLAMARKATLARFLEKRLHRLSHARPYDLNEKFLGSYSTPQPTNMKMMVPSWQQEEMASSSTS